MRKFIMGVLASLTLASCEIFDDVKELQYDLEVVQDIQQNEYEKVLALQNTIDALTEELRETKAELQTAIDLLAEATEADIADVRESIVELNETLADEVEALVAADTEIRQTIETVSSTLSDDIAAVVDLLEDEVAALEAADIILAGSIDKALEDAKDYADANDAVGHYNDTAVRNLIAEANDAIKVNSDAIEDNEEAIANVQIELTKAVQALEIEDANLAIQLGQVSSSLVSLTSDLQGQIAEALSKISANTDLVSDTKAELVGLIEAIESVDPTEINNAIKALEAKIDAVDVYRDFNITFTFSGEEVGSLTVEVPVFEDNWFTVSNSINLPSNLRADSESIQGTLNPEGNGFGSKYRLFFDVDPNSSVLNLIQMTQVEDGIEDLNLTYDLTNRLYKDVNFNISLSELDYSHEFTVAIQPSHIENSGGNHINIPVGYSIDSNITTDYTTIVDSNDYRLRLKKNSDGTTLSWSLTGRKTSPASVSIDLSDYVTYTACADNSLLDMDAYTQVTYGGSVTNSFSNPIYTWHQYGISVPTIDNDWIGTDLSATLTINGVTIPTKYYDGNGTDVIRFAPTASDLSAGEDGNYFNILVDDMNYSNVPVVLTIVDNKCDITDTYTTSFNAQGSTPAASSGKPKKPIIL